MAWVREAGASESPMHYMAKAFAAACLARRGASVEAEVGSFKGADLLADGKLPVEVEALQGSGVRALRRLRATAEKYGRGSEVLIAVPNPQLMLILGEVCELSKILAEEGYGARFATFDVGELELVGLPEVLRRLGA